MNKLSIGRAWDETRDRIARDGKLHVMVAAALIALPLILSLLVAPRQEGQEMTDTGMMMTLIIMPFTQIGGLALISLFLSPGQSVGEAIRRGIGKFLPALGAMILWILPLGVVGYLLFSNMVEIAPGVLDDGQITADEFDQVDVNGGAILGGFLFSIVALYLTIRMMLTNAVAVAGSSNPVEILKGSWAMTKGNVWRLLAFLLLMVVAMLVLLSVANIMFLLIAKLVGGEIAPFSLSALIVALGTAIVQAGFAIVFAGVVARLYAQAAAVPTASVPPTA